MKFVNIKFSIDKNIIMIQSINGIVIKEHVSDQDILNSISTKFIYYTTKRTLLSETINGNL